MDLKSPCSGWSILPVVMRTSLSDIIMRSSSLISGCLQARFRCHRACVTQSHVEAWSTGTGGDHIHNGLFRGGSKYFPFELLKV